MCAGLTYAFTAAYLEGSKEKNKLEMRSFFIRMLKNPPLIAYVTMCLLTLVGIRLPCGLVDFISPMASANAFMAMMMIGLLFRFDARKEQLKSTLEILILRVIFAAVFGAACYFLLPFSSEIRQAIALVVFGPIAAISPAYVGECGGDEGLASCINSISIVISLILMTSLVFVMQG